MNRFSTGRTVACGLFGGAIIVLSPLVMLGKSKRGESLSAAGREQS